MPTPLVSLQAAYADVNRRLLSAVRGLSAAELAWQPYPGGHSIAFSLWHTARWTDHLQATFPGMTPTLAQRLPPGRQLWHREQLAARWGFPPALGESEAGTGYDTFAQGEPPWPAPAALLDYAARAFAAAELALAALDDEQFQAPERLQYAGDPYLAAQHAQSATVGNAVLVHLTHNARHLGEIEYLTGWLRATSQAAG